jgi:phage terminase small subunit
MSAVEHAARGSYVPCLHGPLPPGVIPARRRPVLARSEGKAAPAVAEKATPEPPDGPAEHLTAADCPAVLTPEGRALWGVLVAQRPTDRLLGSFVAMYVEAVMAWQRATLKVQTVGDYGKVGAKAVPNPYLKLRREAEATMFRVATLLGWQAPVQNGALTPMEPPKSRLEMFLAARGGV